MFTLTEMQARLHSQRTRLNIIANKPVPLSDDFYIPLCNYANALYRKTKKLLRDVTPENFYYKDINVFCDLLETQVELLESYHTKSHHPVSQVAVSHARLLRKKKAVEV